MSFLPECPADVSPTQPVGADAGADAGAAPKEDKITQVEFEVAVNFLVDLFDRAHKYLLRVEPRTAEFEEQRHFGGLDRFACLQQWVRLPEFRPFFEVSVDLGPKEKASAVMRLHNYLTFLPFVIMSYEEFCLPSFRPVAFGNCEFWSRITIDKPSAPFVNFLTAILNSKGLSTKLLDFTKQDGYWVAKFIEPPKDEVAENA